VLFAASRPHTGKVAFKRTAAVKFQAFPSVVLWKGDASAIQSLGAALLFLGAQLQPLALDADWWRNNPPAVANGTGAGNLVINILAARIDILRKHELNSCEANNGPDDETGPGTQHMSEKPR